MSLYRVHYQFESGEKRKDYFIFEDENEVKPFMLNIDARLLSIQKRPVSDLNVSMADRIELTRKLFCFLRAKIPVYEALQVAEKQSTGILKILFFILKTEISRGFSLHETFKNLLFPPVFTTTVQLGEQYGDLDNSFGKILRFFQREKKFREEVLSALVYPVMLLLLALGVVIYLVLWVVPIFAEVLVSSGAKLPWFTQSMLNFSNFLKGNLSNERLVSFFLLLFLLQFFFFPVAKWNPVPYLQELFYRLPVVGPTLEYYFLSHFSDSMSILLKGGVPMPESFKTASEMVTLTSMRKRFQIIGPLLESGFSLLQIYDSQGGKMEPMMRDLTLIGEQSNCLPEMFTELALYYSEELETAQKRFLAIFEPILIIV
ncbi:type II secretion system F family protein, partial [Candidatus Riflebacteria bacterium]